MQRVSFGVKGQRRDQRRPVSIIGSIGGARVELVDLSLSGVGGGTVAIGKNSKIKVREGQETTLEFTAPNGRHVALPVKIQRIDHIGGEFGASITGLSEEDFDAIEQLMFPRRAKSPKA